MSKQANTQAPKRPVTLKDVAREAGVSLMTASNVLNRGKVGTRSDAVRRAKRIRKAAAELGYRPHAIAQAMARGRFQNVGLLLSTIASKSNMPHGLLDGVHDALAENGMQLTVAKLPDAELTKPEAMPRVLREWMCDGLLVNYTDHVPEAVIEQIRDYGIPAVWINTKTCAPRVHPDDFGGGAMLTRKLLALGHTDIAYVDFAWGWEDIHEAHYSVVDRQEGYAHAMREAGLEPWVIRADRRVPSPLRAAKWAELLSDPSRPAAIVTYRVSTSVVVHAERLGVRVPQDLSFATFADHLVSRSEFMACAVAQNYEVGHTAASKLIDILEDPGAQPEDQAVPFRFHEGQTAGPPAG